MIKLGKVFFVILVNLLIVFQLSAEATGKDTIVIAVPLDLKSADPYMQSAITWDMAPLWSDRLLGRDLRTGEFKPHLAESWKQVDNLTLEFKLKRGIKFHNGEPFDAKAVKVTLEWYADPSSKSFMQTYLKWINKVEIIDNYTVRIISNNPAPLAILVLADAAPIYPPEYLKGVGPEKFGNEPIGTGPYKFVRWKKGSEVVFTKNEEYFGGLKGNPRVKNFVLRIIPEEATRVAELMSGGVHITYDLSPEQIFFLQKMKDIKIAKVRECRTYFLYMDAVGKTGSNPFQKIKVRQAVAHAIDTGAIVQNITLGLYPETKSVISPVAFGYETNVKQYPYDPEKARSLLSEAGFPKGFEIDLYGHREKSTAEAIMGYLNKVGIKVNLKWYGGQWPALQEVIKAGKVPFGFATWWTSIRDADRVLSLWFTSKGDLSYCSLPDLDKVILEAGSIVDQKRRKELLGKAQQYIADNAFAIPIMGGSRIFGFNANLDFNPTDDEDAWFAAGWK